MSIIIAKQLPAIAFAPTSPAKLATIGPITPQLEAGSGGTLKLYAQHLNDRLGAWSSLADVAGEATLIGTLIHNTPTDAIAFTPGPAEQVLFWFEFDDAGGAPPALLSFSVSWTSDVTAPDAPTISKIISAATADSVPGYRADFNALPAGARHLILEGQLNSGGWLPFSARAKFENGQGYMKFRGDIAAVEAAGERNESHISAAKGLALGDVVQVRIAAEDDVANRSAFTTSDALTIAPAVAAVTPALSIEDATLATGATGTIRVHLHGPTTEDVTVDYASADDTATDPSDYTGISGTLTFTADPADPHQYQDIAINATGDDPTPGTTAYNVVLSNAGGASVDKATGVVSVQALDYVPVLVDSFTVEVSEREEIQVEVS